MTERTIITDAVIRVLMLLVTAVLIPSLKGWIDRNRDNKEMQQVLMMAEVAVKSVADDLKTETGQKRKAEALERLACQVEGWGIKGFDLEELNHYIGTAYTEMKNSEVEPLPIYIE